MLPQRRVIIRQFDSRNRAASNSTQTTTPSSQTSQTYLGNPTTRTAQIKADLNSGKLTKIGNNMYAESKVTYTKEKRYRDKKYTYGTYYPRIVYTDGRGNIVREEFYKDYQSYRSDTMRQGSVDKIREFTFYADGSVAKDKRWDIETNRSGTSKSAQIESVVEYKNGMEKYKERIKQTPIQTNVLGVTIPLDNGNTITISSKGKWTERDARNRIIDQKYINPNVAKAINIEQTKRITDNAQQPNIKDAYTLLKEPLVKQGWAIERDGDRLIGYRGKTRLVIDLDTLQSIETPISAKLSPSALNLGKKIAETKAVMERKALKKAQAELERKALKKAQAELDEALALQKIIDDTQERITNAKGTAAQNLAIKQQNVEQNYERGVQDYLEAIGIGREIQENAQLSKTQLLNMGIGMVLSSNPLTAQLGNQYINKYVPKTWRKEFAKTLLRLPFDMLVGMPLTIGGRAAIVGTALFNKADRKIVLKTYIQMRDLPRELIKDALRIKKNRKPNQVKDEFYRMYNIKTPSGIINLAFTLAAINEVARSGIGSIPLKMEERIKNDMVKSSISNARINVERFGNKIKVIKTGIVRFGTKSIPFREVKTFTPQRIKLLDIQKRTTILNKDTILNKESGYKYTYKVGRKRMAIEIKPKIEVKPKLPRIDYPATIKKLASKTFKQIVSPLPKLYSQQLLRINNYVKPIKAKIKSKVTILNAKDITYYKNQRIKIKKYIEKLDDVYRKITGNDAYSITLRADIQQQLKSLRKELKVVDAAINKKLKLQNRVRRFKDIIKTLTDIKRFRKQIRNKINKIIEGKPTIIKISKKQYRKIMKDTELTEVQKTALNKIKNRGKNKIKNRGNLLEKERRLLRREYKQYLKLQRGLSVKSIREQPIMIGNRKVYPAQMGTEIKYFNSRKAWLKAIKKYELSRKDLLNIPIKKQFYIVTKLKQYRRSLISNYKTIINKWKKSQKKFKYALSTREKLNINIHELRKKVRSYRYDLSKTIKTIKKYPNNIKNRILSRLYNKYLSRIVNELSLTEAQYRALESIKDTQVKLLEYKVNKKQYKKIQLQVYRQYIMDMYNDIIIIQYVGKKSKPYITKPLKEMAQKVAGKGRDYFAKSGRQQTTLLQEVKTKPKTIAKKEMAQKVAGKGRDYFAKGGRQQTILFQEVKTKPKTIVKDRTTPVYPILRISQLSKQKQKQIQKQRQVQKQKQIQKQRQVQKQKQIQKQKQVQKQKQIQKQRQVQKQKQVERQRQKKVPPLKLSEKDLKGRGVNVYVKKYGQRTKYIRANAYPLSLASARNFARYIVDNLPLASYRLGIAKGNPKMVFRAKTPAQKFRYRKGKTRLPSETMVEKAKYRLDKNPEIAGITLKGLQKLRSERAIKKAMSRLTKKKPKRKAKRKKTK